MSEPTPARITMTLAEVFQVYQTVRRLEAEFGKHGLTLAAALMLRAVADHPASPISHYASVLRLTPSVVSSGLDRIEKRGLVRRIARSAEGGSADRRQVFVEVTARGRELLNALAEIEIEL